MTPKERFKIAFLTRLVESGLSFDQIADRVNDLHTQLKTASATGMAPPASPAPEVGTKPLKMPTVGKVSTLKLSGIIGDWLDRGATAAKEIGTLGALGTIGAGGALGYGLGKLTDVDDTDVEEVKQKELIDQYRRWAEHARQQQTLHAHLKATAKPHFAGMY